jgi:uncharacterized protein
VTASPIVQETDGGVIINVHVQPRSGSTVVRGRQGDALRIRVTAPPVDGRATEAARCALGTALGVRPGAVSLVSGERSRVKRFRVDGLATDEALRRVAELVAAT